MLNLYIFQPIIIPNHITDIPKKKGIKMKAEIRFNNVFKHAKKKVKEYNTNINEENEMALRTQIKGGFLYTIDNINDIFGVVDFDHQNKHIYDVPEENLEEWKSIIRRLLFVKDVYEME